jgi:anti-sigma B factor antagonist
VFYQIYTSDDQISVVMTGEITVEESTFMREELIHYIEDGYKTFHVDMRNVHRIDSSGLGLLVSIHNRVQPKGGEVVITGLTGSLKEWFEVTGLTKLLKIE